MLITAQWRKVDEIAVLLSEVNFDGQISHAYFCFVSAFCFTCMKHWNKPKTNCFGFVLVLFWNCFALFCFSCKSRFRSELMDQQRETPVIDFHWLLWLLFSALALLVEPQEGHATYLLAWPGVTAVEGWLKTEGVSVCVWIKIIIITCYLKAYTKTEPTLRVLVVWESVVRFWILRRVIRFSNVVRWCQCYLCSSV